MRDIRVRNLTITTLSVDTQTEALPSDFKSLESVYLEGDTYFGEIQIVSPGDLGEIEKLHGSTGLPVAAAIIGQNLRFAPQPDQTYTMTLSYWATITALSTNNQSNWLLDAHPDIYLYASLIESAPYLRDDQRVPLWEAGLQRRLEELNQHIMQQSYSGRMQQIFTALD